MEICMMDTNPSSSHFYQQGIGSNQMYKNANYETIGGEQSYTTNDINQFQSSESSMPGPSHNIPLRGPQISQQPSIQYSSEIDNQHSIQPWKAENIEFKQEIDRTHLDEGNDVGGERYNPNFGSYGGESTHHSYYNSSSSSSFSDSQTIYNRDNCNVGGFNPYQLPASKSQLPSWYQPPSQVQSHPHYNPHQQQHQATFYPPNFYPQQNSYQANYMGASPSPLTTEHNMRNMIQMSVNR